jgi:hypothetical protein
MCLIIVSRAFRPSVESQSSVSREEEKKRRERREEEKKRKEEKEKERKRPYQPLDRPSSGISESLRIRRKDEQEVSRSNRGNTKMNGIASKKSNAELSTYANSVPFDLFRELL